MQYLKSTFFCRPLLLLACLYTGFSANADAQNCQVQLSQRTLDYGNMTRTAIVDQPGIADRISLGTRDLTLNVLCQHPTAMTLIVRGATGQDGFKFGDKGQFTMRLSDALLDGQPISLGLSQTRRQLATEPGSTIAVVPGAEVIPLAAGQAAKGKNLSLQVHIDPEVTDAATRVRGHSTWEGNAIFTVVER